MENASTLVFIGNGFDVAAGFKTSYKDFYKSPFFNKITESNPIAKHIVAVNEELQKSNQWADFEAELYNYAKWLEGEEEPDKKFEEQYNELRRALFQFIRNAVDSSFYLNTIPIIEELARQWSAEPNVKFISFNYTPILAGYFKQLGLAEPTIRYVHGNMYQGTLENPRIAVGLDESMEVSSDYQFLYKSFDNSTYDNYRITEMIGAAKRIIIFGCTMGQTDTWYFEQVFKEATGKIIELYVFQRSRFLDFQNRIVELSKMKFADFQDRNHIILLDSEDLSSAEIERKRFLKRIKEYDSEQNTNIGSPQ